MWVAWTRTPSHTRMLPRCHAARCVYLCQLCAGVVTCAQAAGTESSLTERETEVESQRTRYTELLAQVEAQQADLDRRLAKHAEGEEVRLSFTTAYSKPKPCPTCLADNRNDTVLALPVNERCQAPNRGGQCACCKQSWSGYTARRHVYSGIVVLAHMHKSLLLNHVRMPYPICQACVPRRT